MLNKAIFAGDDPREYDVVKTVMLRNGIEIWDWEDESIPSRADLVIFSRIMPVHLRAALVLLRRHRESMIFATRNAPTIFKNLSYKPAGGDLFHDMEVVLLHLKRREVVSSQVPL